MPTPAYIPDVLVGQPLSASEHNANVRAPLRMLQLAAGLGILITQTPIGSIIAIDPAYVGTGTGGTTTITYNVAMTMHGHMGVTDGGYLSAFGCVVGGVD